MRKNKLARRKRQKLRNRGNKKINHSLLTKSSNNTDIDSKTTISLRVRRSVLGKRIRRAATARPERLWNFGIIPYEIETNFSGQHKALFKLAMRHWENYTCLSFIEKQPEHTNYIVFTEKPCG